jgi:hypothetical protein
MLRPFDDDRRYPMLRKLHRDRRLTGDDLRVAFFLLMPVDETAHTRTTPARVAELAGVTVEDVVRCVRRLEALGYLKARFNDERAASAREVGVLMH